MAKYLQTNSTSKEGVNYIKTLVDSHNCIFQKIDQENDIGIDAIIEIIINEEPTCNFFACQIKSGKTYFDKKANCCKIPIEKHRVYWSKHPLPVYGIVCIPEFGDAYWIDIKRYLQNNPTDNVISFERTLANQLTKETFISIFVPHLTHQTPDISFAFAKSLFESEKPDEFYLGFYTLYRKYADQNETWQLFVNYFLTQSIENIPPIIIYYLAHLPWHTDIAYYQGRLTKEAQEFGKTLLRQFTEVEILKLFQFVDEENMIARGTIGQSVEAIVSIIPNFKVIPEGIIKDTKLEIHIREVAATIYAYHLGKKSIDVLKMIPKDESWYIPEVVNHILTYGEFNPYV